MSIVADLDRPEAPSASFVPQIGVAIRGADENALARLDHFLAAVARAIAFRLVRVMKAFSCAASARLIACISATSISHLPLSAGDILASGDVGQIVGEPLPAENAAGR